MAEKYRFKVGVRIYRGAEDEVGTGYHAGQTISHQQCEALLGAKEIRPEWIEPADEDEAFPFVPPPDDGEEEA